MITGQALEIVLSMAKEMRMNRRGEWNADFTTLEKEAIEEVEFLLTTYEDTGSYTEEDYC